MNRQAKTLMIAAFALFATSQVFAAHGHRHVNGHRYDDGYRVEKLHNRLQRQFTRIEHGIENGSLTRKEERKLFKQQRRIRRLAREFHDDGYLSQKEHRVLQRKLDKASNRIRRFKHNDANRYCRLDAHNHERLSHDPASAYAWDETDRMAAVRMLDRAIDR